MLWSQAAESEVACAESPALDRGRGLYGAMEALASGKIELVTWTNSNLTLRCMNRRIAPAMST